MLSNPPYGKSWKSDQERMGGKGGIKDRRFVIEHVGDGEYSLITRSSDGQMLFLANMLSKMKHGTKLGSRVATATRELNALVAQAVLARVGTTGKGTFYVVGRKGLTKGSKGSSAKGLTKGSKASADPPLRPARKRGASRSKRPASGARKKRKRALRKRDGLGRRR